MTKKEKWVKPVLVILTRGRLEEAVLSACKSAGSGPVYDYNYCTTGTGSMACTTGCSAVSAS